MMIKNFQVDGNATTIETTWDPPSFLPSSYTQLVGCSLLCDPNSIYTRQTETGNSTATRFVTACALPGSRCLLAFKAVYNPVADDPGKFREIITSSTSELIDSHHTRTTEITTESYIYLLE